MDKYFCPNLKLVRNKKFGNYMDGSVIVPINVEISICGRCNAKCPWCFYGKNKDVSVLPRETIVKLWKDMASLGVESVAWTGGGEPTLHPDFDQITKLKYTPQGMFTNGSTEIKYPKNFDWIRVSFSNLKMNIENLKKFRECETLGLAFNYRGAEDRDDLLRAMEITHEVDADYLQVRPALNGVGVTKNIEPPDIIDDKLILARYKFEDHSIPKEYTQCEAYHFIPFVWHDGRVDVCAYRQNDDAYNLGNICQDFFGRILKNRKKSVPVHASCMTCCRNHEINKTIHLFRYLKHIAYP